MKILARLLVFLTLLTGAAHAMPAASMRAGLINNGTQPSLNLNFALWAGKTTIDPRVPWVRASSDNCFNSSGTLVALGNNIPCLAFNPTTLAYTGPQIEESRINSIRNNTMVGAVASVPITAQTITALTNVTTTATLATTPAAHGLATGNIITVSGVTPAAYNGTFSVTVLSGTTLSYTMASNPGGSASPVGSYTAFTAGTQPNNWALGGSGITIVNAAPVVESGITAIDERFTSVTAQSAQLLFFDATNAASATAGQVWSAAPYVRLVGGSLTNLTDIEVTLRFYDNTNTFISQSITTFTPTSAALAGQRPTGTATAPANTAFVVTTYRFNTSGAYDFTLRIGLPQLEPGAFPTSVISTSGTAQTRQADVASMAVGPWFSRNAGTLIVKAFPAGASSAYYGFANFNDNTGNNRFGPIISGGNAGFEYETGGSYGENAFKGVSYNTSIINAHSFNRANQQGAVNGTVSGIVSTGVPLSAVTQLAIGSTVTSATGAGTINFVRYYPFAMNANQLRAATQ